MCVRVFCVYIGYVLCLQAIFHSIFYFIIFTFVFAVWFWWYNGTDLRSFTPHSHLHTSRGVSRHIFALNTFYGFKIGVHSCRSCFRFSLSLAEYDTPATFFFLFFFKSPTDWPCAETYSFELWECVSAIFMTNEEKHNYNSIILAMQQFLFIYLYKKIYWRSKTTKECYSLQADIHTHTHTATPIRDFSTVWIQTLYFIGVRTVSHTWILFNRKLDGNHLMLGHASTVLNLSIPRNFAFLITQISFDF